MDEDKLELLHQRKERAYRLVVSALRHFARIPPDVYEQHEVFADILDDLCKAKCEIINLDKRLDKRFPLRKKGEQGETVDTTKPA